MDEEVYTEREVVIGTYSGSGADDPKLIGSPAWWVKRLSKKMANRRQALLTYSNYYEGIHRLAFASEKFRSRFGNLFHAFSDNWCDLVVDAVGERLTPQGFRIPQGGEGAASTDVVTGDAEAWDIWQRNELDLFSRMGHTSALMQGETAAIVWWDDAGKKAVITVEDPLEVVVETQASSLSVRAGLKQWQDDSGFIFCTLYLPDYVWKFKSRRKAAQVGVIAQDVQWDPREVADEDWPLGHDFGEVPVVPIFARPKLSAWGVRGVSEIRQVIPAQDAVNKVIADMLIGSEVQGFKQRAVLGMDVPTDPETNEPLKDEIYRQFLDKLWIINGETDGQQPQIWESGEIDLEGYVKAIELLVQHIASRTRTPPHYFYLSGQFPSGESIKSAETGLVAKTRDRMLSFGESWEKVIRLAFKAENNSKADVFNSEVIWGDPEYRSEAEHIDALIKLSSIGVPEEQLWEDAGYSPQQIERFKAMREEQAKLAPTPVLLAPGAPSPNGTQPVPVPRLARSNASPDPRGGSSA